MFKKNTNKEDFQRRVSKLETILETILCEEQFWDFGVLIVEERILRGDLIAIFKYLNAYNMENQ